MHKEEIHGIYKTVYKFTNYGVYEFSKFIFQMNERSVDSEAQVSAAYYENQ